MIVVLCTLLVLALWPYIVFIFVYASVMCNYACHTVDTHAHIYGPRNLVVCPHVAASGRVLCKCLQS